jgi:hypothetical protein
VSPWPFLPALVRGPDCRADGHSPAQDTRWAAFGPGPFCSRNDPAGKMVGIPPAGAIARTTPVSPWCDRHHDAFYEPTHAETDCRRIAAERAGQPVKAWVHISLADLMLLDADSALQEQWTAHVREQ